MRTRGFTLIELLIVTAISAVLMTLIVIPVMQSINLTQTGRGFADAQSKARLLAERIAKEIENSAGVRDNTGVRGAITVVVPRGPSTPGDQANPIPVTLLNAKIDILKAAQEGTVQQGTAGFVNPRTGKVDPTLKGPKGQIVLPVAPGLTMVRYFIGLRDPLDVQGYNNPYDGLLVARNGQRDNLYVLYRAEVQPYEMIPDPSDPNEFLVRANEELFETDSVTGALILDDPAFFTMIPGTDYTVNGAITNDAKATRIRHWLREATIVTEVSRYDMIRPIYDKKSRAVVYDGGARPRLMPLVQFRPTRVSSEAAEGLKPVRLGEESEFAMNLAPDVYKTGMGGWSSAIVRTFGADHSPSNPATSDYLVGLRPMQDPNRSFSIYYYDPGVDPQTPRDDTQVGTIPGAGVEMFNISLYEQASRDPGQFAFTAALQPYLPSFTTRMRELFVPYFVNGASGQLVASFGIHEVGTTPPSSGDPNVPRVLTGDPYSPISDPTAESGGPLDPNLGINQRFNRLWMQRPEYRALYERFIDLRVTSNLDGTLGPLNPAEQFSRVRIVPGSEEVIGPDQRPGPGYGMAVRYIRTTGQPGPNQYRINYVDQAEPIDYAELGLNPTDLSEFNPGLYNPANFVSAVVQPRFKKGYLQLNSDPNVPLPLGEIRVFYRFQFTQPGDVMAVDYDSREMLSVLLTIRNFPQSNAPNPQTVTLKASAKVRNYLR